MQWMGVRRLVIVRGFEAMTSRVLKHRMMLLLWSAPQPLALHPSQGLKVVPALGSGLGLPEAWAGSMRRGLIGDGPRRPFPKRQYINRRGRVVWIPISCRTKASALAHRIVGFLVFILGATAVIDIDTDTRTRGSRRARWRRSAPSRWTWGRPPIRSSTPSSVRP